MPMPASWTSASMGSVRRATATVGTVFRCVASRNRERVFYWGSLRLISNRACGQKSGSASQPVWPPTPRRGPTLSGRINLVPLPRSSRGAPTFCDATESRQRTQPRGLPPPWLSPAATRTWRRKTQSSCAERHRAPTGGRWLARPYGSQLFNLPTNYKQPAEKFVLGRGAARHTNRAASTPSRGRRCKASRPALQNFSAKKSAASLRPRSPDVGRRYPPRQAAIRRSTRRDCVFR